VVRREEDEQRYNSEGKDCEGDAERLHSFLPLSM